MSSSAPVPATALNMSESSADASYWPAYKGWVLGLVFLMMASNYIDRNIIRILAQPIKQEFHLSDTEVGLLGGFAFAVLYIALGVPIASFSERHSRVKIISAAIAVWSIMTVFCGLAANYLQLFAARVGVGVGEAGASPPSQSLLSDYFPPHRRASVLSIHSVGIAVGSIAGAVIGGLAAEAWGWRAALMLVGVPGLLLALLFWLTVKEPPRGHTDRGAAPYEKPSLRQAARRLFTNATFLHLALGAGVANFAVQGIHTFEALYFVRRFDISLSQVGFVVGIVGGGSATIGMLGGGFLSDWLAARDRRWYTWIPATGVALTGPLYIAAFSQGTWLASAVLLAVPGALFFLFAAPTQAVIQNMCHARMRATAISLYMVVTATLGIAMGPVAVGFAADWLSQVSFAQGLAFAEACPGGIAPEGAGTVLQNACRDASATGLRYALIAVCFLFLWSAMHFVLAARTVRRDMRGVTGG